MKYVLHFSFCDKWVSFTLYALYWNVGHDKLANLIVTSPSHHPTSISDPCRLSDKLSGAGIQHRNNHMAAP